MTTSSTPVVIAGAGNLGKLLFDCIDGDDRWQVVGFIDDGHAGEDRFGLPVFSCDAYDPRLTRNVIIAIGYPATRRQMVRRLAPLDLDWRTYVDRRAIVGREAALGRGAIVLGFATVASGVRIGEFTFVSGYSNIGTGSQIGAFTSVMVGATVGESVIGQDCVLGLRSACLDHATLGDGVTLAPYTLVRKPIPAGALVTGSPARIVMRGDGAVSDAA